jgi:hypothetical protein
VSRSVSSSGLLFEITIKAGLQFIRFIPLAHCASSFLSRIKNNNVKTAICDNTTISNLAPYNTSRPAQDDSNKKKIKLLKIQFFGANKLYLSNFYSICRYEGFEFSVQKGISKTKKSKR